MAETLHIAHPKIKKKSVGLAIYGDVSAYSRKNLAQDAGSLAQWVMHFTMWNQLSA